MVTFFLAWLIGHWLNDTMELCWHLLLKRKSHLHIIFKCIFIFVAWYFWNYWETGSVSAYFQVLAAWCVSICWICQDLHIRIWDIHLSLGNYTFILNFSLLHIKLVDIKITILCWLYILIRLLIIILLSILLSVINSNFLLVTRLTPVSNEPLIIFRMLSFCDFINIPIIRSFHMLILGSVYLIVLYFNVEIRTWIILLKIILRSVLWCDTLMCIFIWWLGNVKSKIFDSWY